MEIITLELPDFWADALFYNNTCKLGYEDKKQFEDFSNWLWTHYKTFQPVDMEGEPHFSKLHNATRFGVLACNVHRYTFLSNKEWEDKEDFSDAIINEVRGRKQRSE